MKKQKANFVKLNQCLRFFLVSTGAMLRIALYLLLLFPMCMACRDEGLHSRVVRVEGGYGYVILHGNDTLIVQPYMPAVSGKVPFASERHAQAVAELVCRKLMAGDSPVVSRADVEALK